MNAPSVERPLAQYAGNRPPRPDWYGALQIEPEEVLRPVIDGAEIEVLVWGRKDRPGVLLAHGSRAHARWWGPVAPLLASEYRVASLSWSGMGGSQWRSAYSLDQQVRELFGASQAAGLADCGTPPVFIAHSFGTRALSRAVVARGDEISGAILVDGIVTSNRQPPVAAKIVDPHYSSLADGLARFNLKPAQQYANAFILDEIARASLEQSEAGWRWRFDPEFYHKFDRLYDVPAIGEAKCRLAVVYGEQSSVVTEDELAATRALARAGTPFIGIPEAGHHVMVDQPIALTTALRSIIAAWAQSDCLQVPG